MADRLDAFVTLVEQLGCPTVVCVQEVFVAKVFGISLASAHASLCEKMRGCGYATAASRQTVPWIMGQNSGLVTFVLVAKAAVVSFHEQAFRSSGEMVCNKGFQQVVLRSVENGSLFCVFNVHLESKSEDAKKDQVSELGHAVRQVNIPVIVAGDFNICQQHRFDNGESYSHLCKEMFPLQDLFGDAGNKSSLRCVLLFLTFKKKA